MRPDRVDPSGSDSPSPAAESPPSPSSGPVNPSPASCGTAKTRQTRRWTTGMKMESSALFCPE